MKRISAIVAGCSVVALAWVACAQTATPFFSGTATAFEPQIGIVNVGVVLDAQAVVSHDMKYVTLNMQAQNTSLLALREFTFQKPPPLGVAGLPQTALPLAPGPHADVPSWNPLNTSPSDIKRQADSWVLERQGMFRVADAP